MSFYLGEGVVEEEQSLPCQVVSSNQLALQFFEDFPLGITTATQDVGYNKPKALIQVSSLSLLSRRALNALYFLISDSKNEDQYLANLNYFKWLIGYDSNNSAYLKKAFREAQQSAIDVSTVDTRYPDRESWISVPLLGKVGISNGQIAFTVDPSVKKMIVNPEQFSYLSLRILASFTGQYVIELYEKLLTYLDHGVTPWFAVENIDKELIAMKGGQKEFKYINRDVITPSITQINELSNIKAVLETQTAPGSRKISHIRFIVQNNPNGQMVIGSDIRMKMQELHQVLSDEFGLSEKQIEHVAQLPNGQSVEKLWSSIEYVRSRIESGAKIGILAKYLMAALDGGWSVPKGKLVTDEGSLDLAAPTTPKKKLTTPPDLSSDVVDGLIMSFFASFMDDGPASLATTWGAFLASTAGKQLSNNKGGLSRNYERELKGSDQDIRLAFAKWFQKRREKH